MVEARIEQASLINAGLNELLRQLREPTTASSSAQQLKTAQERFKAADTMYKGLSEVMKEVEHAAGSSEDLSVPGMRTLLISMQNSNDTHAEIVKMKAAMRTDEPRQVPSPNPNPNEGDTAAEPSCCKGGSQEIPSTYQKGVR